MELLDGKRPSNWLELEELFLEMGTIPKVVSIFVNKIAQAEMEIRRDLLLLVLSQWAKVLWNDR